MKVVILAGGLGTRLAEETETKPKPMVLIDDKPILWHIMNIFATQGSYEFVVALGYKGGHDTQTGGRIAKCMKEFPGERIIVTYGDGLANVPIKKLLAFHESHGKLATVTAVHPPARFGYLHLDGNKVDHFGEKKQSDVGWINGGFFVLEPEVVNFVLNDSEPFETGALPRLVDGDQLMAFHHTDFWQPMDTLRERNELAELAKETPPPWLKLD